MTDELERRPEGQLLYDAMKRKNLSFRSLASRIGLSDARVRNVINGYQAVGQGQRIDVTGPEDTVARLAQALDVTPEQLESVGRADAAYALQRRLPDGPMPDWARGVTEDVEIWRQIVATHEEIREWSEDPENYVPPDAILDYFSTDSLMGEVHRRLGLALRGLGPYYWQSDVEAHPIYAVMADYKSKGGDEDGSTNEATEAEKNQFRLAAKHGKKEPEDEPQ